MKRIIALIMSLLMLASVFTGLLAGAAAVAEASKGDLDADGEVTVSDSLIILRLAAGIIEADEDMLDNADIDGDGTASVVDALEILRISLGLAAPIVSETAVTFDNVRVYGRNVANATKVSANWPNAGIEIRFVGRSLSLEITCPYAFSNSDSPYIQVWIDGERASRFQIKRGTNTYNVARRLKFGEHTVKVLMVTETSMYPFTFDSLSITSDSGATRLLEPVYDEHDLKFDVYGDSITAGMGNIPGYDDSAGKKHHDSSGTYAFYTVDHYGGDGNYVAHSGWGCYQGWGVDMNAIIPRIWNRAVESSSTPWDFTQRQVDIVIVALGTNDAWFWEDTMSHQIFIDAYLDFLGDMRKVYPEAQFYCLHGMMDETFNDVVKEAARQYSLIDSIGAVYVEMPNMEDQAEFVGSAGHPSNAHGEYASTVLIEAIESNYFSRWNSKLKMAYIKLERKDTEGAYTELIELAKATIEDHEATGKNPKLLCEQIEEILEYIG